MALSWKVFSQRRKNYLTKLDCLPRTIETGGMKEPGFKATDFQKITENQWTNSPKFYFKISWVRSAGYNLDASGCPAGKE